MKRCYLDDDEEEEEVQDEREQIALSSPPPRTLTRITFLLPHTTDNKNVIFAENDEKPTKSEDVDLSPPRRNKSADRGPPSIFHRPIPPLVFLSISLLPTISLHIPSYSTFAHNCQRCHRSSVFWAQLLPSLVHHIFIIFHCRS